MAATIPFLRNSMLARKSGSVTTKPVARPGLLCASRFGGSDEIYSSSSNSFTSLPRVSLPFEMRFNLLVAAFVVSAIAAPAADPEAAAPAGYGVQTVTVTAGPGTTATKTSAKSTVTVNATPTSRSSTSTKKSSTSTKKSSTSTKKSSTSTKKSSTSIKPTSTSTKKSSTSTKPTSTSTKISSTSTKSSTTSSKRSSTTSSKTTVTAAPVATTSKTTTSSTKKSSTTTSKTTAAAAAVPTTLEQIALYHHNIHRSNHSASNIDSSSPESSSKLTVDDSTAGGGGYGQNIAAGVKANNISSVITELFYNGEMPYYSTLYGQAQPSYDNFAHWGHFSQLVWKDTKTIGCAVQYCPGGLKNTGNYGGEYADNIGRPLGRAVAHWNTGL
nr:putative pathogenesis-related protein [Quercus suber]